MNRELVDYLTASGRLVTPRLIAAFRLVDRADFVPPTERIRAYFDQPLPLGYGQTISQPTTVAFMLELLEPQAGHKVLDVGAGSGFQTALLAYLVSHDSFRQELPPSRRGLVVGLEFIPELARQAKKNLHRYSFLKKGVAEIHCLNAARGYEPAAPFDRIISAAAGETVPEAWKRQLKVGGRMVLPIDHTIILMVKKSDTEFETHRFEGFSFVPFVPDSEPDE